MDVNLVSYSSRSRSEWENDCKEEAVELISEFFFGAFNAIIRQYGDYPAGSFFTTSKIFGLNVQISSNSQIVDYIFSGIKNIMCLLITHELIGIELHLLERKEVRQRFVFHFNGKLDINAMFGPEDDEPMARDKIHELTTTLTRTLEQLLSLPVPPPKSRSHVSSNPFLPVKPSRFRLRLGISQESYNSLQLGARWPHQDEGDMYTFPWEKSTCPFANKDKDKDIPCIEISPFKPEPKGHSPLRSGESEMNINTDKHDRFSPELFDAEDIDEPKSKVTMIKPELELSNSQFSSPISSRIITPPKLPDLVSIDSFVIFETLMINFYMLSYTECALPESGVIRRRSGSFRTQDLNSPKDYKRIHRRKVGGSPLSSKASPKSSRVGMDKSNLHSPVRRPQSCLNSPRSLAQVLEKAPGSLSSPSPPPMPYYANHNDRTPPPRLFSPYPSPRRSMGRKSLSARRKL